MKNERIGKYIIGERLRRFRAERKLSQIQLARLSEISISQISRYENNTAYPNAIVIKKLSDTLDISFEDLAGFEKIEKLNLNAFDRTVEIAKKLPQSDLIMIKEIMEKFIESNNLHSLIMEKSR